MKLALVQLDTKSILYFYPDGQMLVDLNISGRYQAYSVGAGWVSDDRNYTLVQVTPFVVPDGKVTSSAPTYSLDANNNVIESYDVVDAPPPPAPPSIAVSPLDFIGLLTQAEALAITTAGQTDAQVSLFITMASAADLIHMNDPRTIGGLQYLESKGLLTADRVTKILAGTPPGA